MIKALLARLRRKRHVQPPSDHFTAMVKVLSMRPPEAVMLGSVRVLREHGPVPLEKRAEFVAAVMELAAARLAAERERKGARLQ